MYSIAQTIAVMKESNYFFAWENVLLGESVTQEWQQLLQDSSNSELYFVLAKRLHDNSVPYVIVSEYIDEFFRYYEHNTQRHEIKNKIAQAYLHKKLTMDKKLIEVEVNKKISLSIESKHNLINAHLIWMKSFICNIIGKPTAFELHYMKCHVGTWLEEENDTISSQLYENHKNLHSMAQSALRMYNKHDYAYFLLLYSDMLASSYQIRDTIMNIYFSRRIVSIYKDQVTGKANYFQLKSDLENRKLHNSIMMFNIKEFSKINLLYGHDVGDEIIKEISDIVEIIPDVQNVYRIYGDEFVAIFETLKKAEVVETIKSILHENEFMVNEDSITLSFYGSVADVSVHVLEHCEYGLMMSKHHYGDIVDVSNIQESVFYKYANEITLAQQLRLAFLDNRILTHYQPIMDIKTGEITKYEVLMRLRGIDSKILEPVDFLDVLHEMYIYPEVTKLIIKNSFEFFKENSLDFSVNISFADIINIETKSFILALIKRYPDVSARCTFELLENEAILNEVEVNDFFTELHSFGVKIALDDFGVGYSNYDSIFKFDIDYIKIDGSLTESILSSSKSKVLIESITTVARKLNAKVIVEFVSSKEIYDVVSKMDIDYVQGYYIGKPSENLMAER